MTAAQFQLTEVPKWQKITVRTEDGSLTRDHVSFTGPTSGGTASYDIAIDAKLTGAPAVAYITNDAWTGTFVMTGATCRAPEAAQLSGQGSSCGNEPQISVRVSNSNPVAVTYQVGGQLPDQSIQVGSGQSEDVVFGPVERGRGYRVTAEGSDGTTGSTWVNVPACTVSTPANPPTPTTAPTAAPAQGASTVPAVPGAPTSTTAPAKVVVSTTSASTPSPSASVTASASASATPVPVPTVETDVDPFTPLLQAEADGSDTVLAAAEPTTVRGVLSNSTTLFLAVILIAGFGVGGALVSRRRPNGAGKRN